MHGDQGRRGVRTGRRSGSEDVVGLSVADAHVGVTL